MSFRLEVREFRMHGNVQDKIEFFFLKTNRSTDVQVKVSVEVDERV